MKFQETFEVLLKETLISVDNTPLNNVVHLSYTALNR